MTRVLLRLCHSAAEAYCRLPLLRRCCEDSDHCSNPLPYYNPESRWLRYLLGSNNTPADGGAHRAALGHQGGLSRADQGGRHDCWVLAYGT